MVYTSVSRTTSALNGSSSARTFCPLPFSIFWPFQWGKKIILWMVQSGFRSCICVGCFSKLPHNSSLPVVLADQTAALFDLPASVSQGCTNNRAAQSLVIIPHQHLGCWVGQIGGNVHIHPVAFDVTARVYGTATWAPCPLHLDLNTPSLPPPPLFPSQAL